MKPEQNAIQGTFREQNKNEEKGGGGREQKDIGKKK